MNPPKVFISYSWNPTANKIKVLQLADRLSADYVHVIIDEWDLKEGQDKYQFMEQMVNNPDVVRVLLICNKDYAEKANARKGGVGVESLIVSDEIYSKADQTKFIPVVFEYDNGKACVPTFVHSRIYIDLSSDAVFEENYEKLLRNIFNKPHSKRPPIGTIPAFLESEDPVFLPTAHKVATIKNALLNEKKNTSLYIQNYLDTFIGSLQQFVINLEDINQNNFDEAVLKSIEELKSLRDDFVNFIDTYLSFSLDFDGDKIHAFFEHLLGFLMNLDEYNYPNHTIQYLKSDNFRFFYYELFLTFSAIMIKKERFDGLAYIIQTPFIIDNKGTNKIDQFTFSEFRQYVYTLNEYRNKKYALNKVSITADMIKQRASDNFDFNALKNADVLLYYLSLLFPNTKVSYGGYWFPETSCYRNWSLKLLPKTVSERYFNRVKVLFGIDNKEQLIERVNTIISSRRNVIEDRNFIIPAINKGLGLEEMCTLK